jgi:hypothetical protein
MSDVVVRPDASEVEDARASAEILVVAHRAREEALGLPRNEAGPGLWV